MCIYMYIFMYIMYIESPQSGSRCIPPVGRRRQRKQGLASVGSMDSSPISGSRQYGAACVIHVQHPADGDSHCVINVPKNSQRIPGL